VLDRLDVLVFALGGLSKSVGLPQVKLGWIALGGPPALVSSALERLEFIADSYLSVSTPVQAAAAELLAAGSGVRAQIAERVAANYRQLAHAVAGVPACRLLASEGGWYAVLQVPTLQPEEELVLELLLQDHVLVHPGFFFDFPRESYLALSLLPAGPTFTSAAACILRRFLRVERA
jgi:hypothetical protein